MNERTHIERIHAAHPIADGSTPADITPQQQKARNVAGRLLLHAKAKGRRKRGQWG